MFRLDIFVHFCLKKDLRALKLYCEILRDALALRICVGDDSAAARQILAQYPFNWLSCSRFLVLANAG